MSRTNQWYLAVDNAIVVAHIGTAEMYATPELAVNALCCWSQDVGAHFAKERIEELEKFKESAIRVLRLVVSGHQAFEYQAETMCQDLLDHEKSKITQTKK